MDLASHAPTSALPTLLHTVLVHMQGEEHVGGTPGVFPTASTAGAAGCQGRVQVEGRLLCRGCTQLILVLEL